MLGLIKHKPITKDHQIFNLSYFLFTIFFMHAEFTDFSIFSSFNSFYRFPSLVKKPKFLAKTDKICYGTEMAEPAHTRSQMKLVI